MTQAFRDPMVDILLRFSKAISDGTARDNLKLLAQVIAGLKKNKALQPDKFRKWAGVLEPLTRDELIVLGTAYRLIKEDPTLDHDSFWKAFRGRLTEGKYGDAGTFA
jgi:hypothetical protein